MLIYSIDYIQSYESTGLILDTQNVIQYVVTSSASIWVLQCCSLPQDP